MSATTPYNFVIKSFLSSPRMILLDTKAKLDVWIIK